MLSALVRDYKPRSIDSHRKLAIQGGYMIWTELENNSD